MKCTACGYDDNEARRDSHFSRYPEKVKEFVPITINYEKQVIDACHTQFHWQTLYACPNCGTVRMEV